MNVCIVTLKMFVRGEYFHSHGEFWRLPCNLVCKQYGIMIITEYGAGTPIFNSIHHNG